MDYYQIAMDIFRQRLKTDDESLLQDLTERTDLKQVPKGTVLFREGCVLRDCYSLVDGIVRISYLMDGEEITESLVSMRGTVLYPSIALTGVDDLANGTVTALTDCTLLHMSVRDLFEIRRAHPEFVNIQLQLVLGFVDRSFKLKRQLTHMSPTERYLWFAENRPYLLENVPQKYIASFLGMTPVSLSRIRGKLKERETPEPNE